MTPKDFTTEKEKVVHIHIEPNDDVYIRQDDVYRLMEEYHHYKLKNNGGLGDNKNLILLTKSNYKDKNGTIKKGIKINEEYYAPKDDYEFNLHQHWKDEDGKTSFDSKPIGGFNDW